MAKKNINNDTDYLNGMGNSTSGANPVGNGATVPSEQPKEESGDFDYYQALKDENYKSLLNNQVQLANARQQALKNTNVGLNAMGFGSAGYGALQRNGIESAYMQGLEQNQNDFVTRNLDINKQQYEAEQNAMNENFQSFNNIIGAGMENGYITSADQLDDYFNRYGFLDSEGNFDRAKVAEQYGEESAKQMELVYEMWKSQLGQESNTAIVNGQEQEVDSTNSFALGGNWDKQAYQNIKDQNGKTGKLNDEFSWLGSHQNILSDAKNGTVLKISDNDNDGSYVYFVYNNGRWVQTNYDAYSKSKDSYWVRSYKNESNYMLVDHNGERVWDGKKNNSEIVEISAPDYSSFKLIVKSGDIYEYEDPTTGYRYNYNQKTGKWYWNKTAGQAVRDY